MRCRAVAWLVVFAVLGFGCGGDDAPGSAGTSSELGDSAELTLDEVAARMRELVDATAGDIFAARTIDVLSDLDRHGCGSETETVQFDYELSVELDASRIDEAMEEITERWSKLGVADDDPGSAVTFLLNGYSVGATPFPEADRVTIGGATDCFSPTP